jgi:glycosyltransferase involved in cell wall biosynthesis
MRVLVFPASLDLGGSQLNAIEISGRLRERGNDVWIFGQDGPLVDTLASHDLPFLPAPANPKLRPSPSMMSALDHAVTSLDIDVVHGYEWPPIMEAVYGPYLRRGVAVTGTIMSMGVAPFIPGHIPLAVGTRQIADSLVSRSGVHVMEPPVDTDLNQPWRDVRDVRESFAVQPNDFLVVVVSRLAAELKREGLLAAVKAAEALAETLPIRLLIVGDGPAQVEVSFAAEQANARAGRVVVQLVGELTDPRPAYAAADVTFGMGSSALRAMAFGKPLIVQGERGYWKLFEPDSANDFSHQGWYGIGAGDDGAARFAGIVRALYADPDRRAMLGRYSRQFVVARFGLDRAADQQEQIYKQAVAQNPDRRVTAPGLVAPLVKVVGYDVRRRYARMRGHAPMDDFNALSKQPGRPKQPKGVVS